MIDLLLYISISCQDAADVISRVNENDNVSKTIQTEVIETLKEATPQCDWDAND
jgi:hypothetical protein